MTLQTRLTAAFLAVVLGPVLLGAVFVGYTVGAVSQERAAHQLDVAAGAVRSAVAGLCQQLRAVAELAADAGPSRQPAVAAALVDDGPVTAVRVLDGDGAPLLTAGRPPLPRWADCDSPSEPVGSERFRAIAVSAPLSGPDHPPGGEVWAMIRLDQQLVERLAAAAGVAVTIRSSGVTGVLSTDDAVDTTLAAAAEVGDRETTESPDGRWVRRLDPAAGQPLSLVLTAPRSHPPAFYPLLTGVVTVAGLLAVLVAWRLGRSTTRPLSELARAADRVAEGDLSARVPVRATDETGRLAATFNRMTHRMQLYVQALTASRDQLRQHLAVLGDTLSGTHDLDRILRVILRTALATTGANAGAVLLVDDQARCLSGHATVPGDDPDGAGEGTVRVTVPLGEGLLGRVAATGEAQQGRISADDPLLHQAEPGCRTYVVVPITAPGGVGVPTPWPAPPGVRGVLALYDRLGGDDFDESDVETLRTFAGQAGVAVDNVRTHREAQRLSLTDPLTGLWNYRYLSEAIRREVERASRFRHSLALLVLDLDRFKEVNDAYGHPAGDAVLVEFARRVRGVIREVDLACRHGGEEFAVMLPETDARGATVLAQRLGAAVRDRPMTITPRGAGAEDELAISVTVSIGIAVYPAHARSPDTLREAADDALYAAKAAGRDTYRVAAAPVEPPAGGAGAGPVAGGPAAGGPAAGGPVAGGPAAGGPAARGPIAGSPGTGAGGFGRATIRPVWEPATGRRPGRPSAGGAQPPRQIRGR